MLARRTIHMTDDTWILPIVGLFKFGIRSKLSGITFQVVLRRSLFSDLTTWRTLTWSWLEACMPSYFHGCLPQNHLYHASIGFKFRLEEFGNLPHPSLESQTTNMHVNAAVKLLTVFCRYSLQLYCIFISPELAATYKQYKDRKLQPIKKTKKKNNRNKQTLFRFNNSSIFMFFFSPL